MARITKAALEAQVNELQAQVAALQAALAQAQAAMAQASTQLEAAQAEREAHTTPSHRVQRAGYVAPAWQAEREAAMAAAKAAAMRMGRTVLVG